MASIELDSGVWYGDRRLELPVPGHWEVNMLWPETPARRARTNWLPGLNAPPGR